MREREDASLTVAASAAPWETLAVVPSVLPEALTERPALVRAPVRGVVRSPVSAVLMAGSPMVPAEAASVVQAPVSEASRRASVSAQRARASEGARDTRPKGRDRAVGSAG